MSDSCDPMDCSPPGSSVHGDSLGKNTGVGCQFLLQGIFPTQGSNLCLLHWQADFFFFFFFLPLSHLGSPCLLDFWFISKDVSQEQSDGRETESKMCGKGRRVHTLSALTPSRNLHNSPSWKLSKTLHSDFSPRLLYMGMIG